MRLMLDILRYMGDGGGVVREYILCKSIIRFIFRRHAHIGCMVADVDCIHENIRDWKPDFLATI